ncbi:MAG TPA: hypothetical protein VJR27_00550 [Candidatus Saccharimonadales bacterium]|nr:hypothetical protein [Candidatus Saccharimonadales bacterium]
MEREKFRGGNREQTQARAERQTRQLFLFGPWSFDVDQAQAVIAERPRSTHTLPVEPWARAYGLDELDNPNTASLIGPGPSFDRRYAMTTDLAEPVMVAVLRDQESGQDCPLLIDGTHRLYRAHQEGIAELPAYVLTVEESLAIRQELQYR